MGDRVYTIGGKEFLISVHNIGYKAFIVATYPELPYYQANIDFHPDQYVVSMNIPEYEKVGYQTLNEALDGACGRLTRIHSKMRSVNEMIEGLPKVNQGLGGPDEE